MGIETGTTISALNAQWPLETDPTHEGNDHLQLIKDVLKKQFPGRAENGDPESGYAIPVTAKAEELNFLEGVTSNVQDQLDAESGTREGLIKRVADVVEVGQDDASMLLRTNGENAVVHTWDDPENPGTPINATVMNALNVVDLIYPVGSVIYSASATNPGDRFTGTTWIAQAEGRFIASVGTHTDANAHEGTIPAGDVVGGTYNHTLTEAELPSHTHNSKGGDAGGPLSGNNANYLTDRFLSGQGSTYPLEDTGGDQPHNNVPPGYGLYVWERTA